MVLAELDLTMALCGYTSPDQLGPDALAEAARLDGRRFPAGMASIGLTLLLAGPPLASPNGGERFGRVSFASGSHWQARAGARPSQ